MTRVGAEERLQPAYNVYTKPLWADKSETIYRARESEAMKYVAEEAMKQAGLGDSLSKQAERTAGGRDAGRVRGSSPTERRVEVERRERGRRIDVFV